jgi:tetratricopeptide (TPR) repeat protein
MLDTDRRARSIETPDDVLAVLESRAASFVELMDCVAVARRFEDWELRHAAAERAFDEINITDASAHGQLPKAADIVIDGFMRKATTLGSLAPQVDQAKGWLNANQSKLNDGGLSDYYDEQAGFLAALLVLLSDDDPQSLVRLSSRLRSVDRADLAIEAATRAVGASPNSHVALTTLGAAQCDMGVYVDSERSLRRALEISPGDVMATTALSRVLQKIGQLVAALDAAKVAFSRTENESTAHRLISAARALDDQVAIDAAAEAIDAAAMATGESPDPFMLILAAEIQLEQGRSARARGLLLRIGSTATRGEVAKRLVALKRRIDAADQARLFDDEDPFGTRPE